MADFDRHQPSQPFAGVQSGSRYASAPNGGRDHGEPGGRWLPLWERLPGRLPALLDRIFVMKSMGLRRRSDDSGNGRLPQG
jgi:hypothetical protein